MSDKVKKAFDKKAYDRDYNKNMTFKKLVSFNKQKDQELIEYIQSIKNFNGYIKNLIIKDMKENQK